MKLRDRLLYYVEHPDALVDDARAAAVIDENAIGRELRNQTAAFQDWAHLATMARYELKKAERHLKDEVVPDLRDAIRAEFKRAERKETIDAIDDQMKLTSVYKEAVRQVDDLQFVSELLEDTADALWERKGCLQSANARDGREFESCNTTT